MLSIIKIEKPVNKQSSQKCPEIDIFYIVVDLLLIFNKNEEKPIMKKNRKVKYTQKVIRESLLKLLESKKIDKITIKELCDVADINRSTFYAHYHNIFDLVNKIEKEIVEDIMNYISLDILTQEHRMEFFENIFENLKQNSLRYKLILVNPKSANCLNHLFEKIYPYSSHILQYKYKELSESQIKYIYSFISRGCTQLIMSWIKNEMRESPCEMAVLMDNILNGKYN